VSFYAQVQRKKRRVRPRQKQLRQQDLEKKSGIETMTRQPGLGNASDKETITHREWGLRANPPLFTAENG